MSKMDFKWRIARLTLILMSTLVSSLCKPNGFFDRLENMFKLPLERTYGTKPKQTKEQFGPKSALQYLKALPTEWSCLTRGNQDLLCFHRRAWTLKLKETEKVMVSSWGIATGKLCCRKMLLMQTVMVLVLEQFIQTVQGQKNFCLPDLTIPDCCERGSPTNKWRRYGQSDQSGGRLPCSYWSIVIHL